MVHDLIAHSEIRYYQDGDFRLKVEETVTVMMNGLARNQQDDEILAQERRLVRMSVALALYMEDERNSEDG